MELDDAKAAIYLAFRIIIENICNSPNLSKHVPPALKVAIIKEYAFRNNDLKRYRMVDFITLINDTNYQLERERLIKNSDSDLII